MADICVCACEACRRLVHGQSQVQSWERSVVIQEPVASSFQISIIIEGSCCIKTNNTY